MVACNRDSHRILLLLASVWLVACATGQAPLTSSSSGGGGSGGGDLGPCGMDCSKVQTAPCTVSVCNTGQEIGPLNTCLVIPAPKGTACDDGQFCTTGDTCDNGACVGGPPNDCDIKAAPCSAVICYEDMKSCTVMPVDEGTACTPTNLCQVEGVCHLGECSGKPKDCTFSPLNECNTVACEPSTGKCVGTPNPSKDDTSCLLTGDLCSTNKKCFNGQCGGGTPKDCSGLDVGCQVGVCNIGTGLCDAAPAPVGAPCSDGIPECHVGTCDAKSECRSAVAPDGSSCNDHSACSQGDTCAGGACSGSSVTGCSIYFSEGFESCPHGWTLSGDWQCGTPANVGPTTAHTGQGVIATQIAGVYSVGKSFNTCNADSPSIDLTKAVNPTLSFWAWDRTEGGTFDGWNLKISTNGGQTFTAVTTVSPAYPLTVANQPAWGGDHSGEGWQIYTADLTAYAGHAAILRFGFRSDGATVYPGVYIDDMVVAEPLQTPIYITTSSPLPDVYAGQDAAMPMVKIGGTSGSVWSIKPGAVNAGWLSIDPATGQLTGRPTAAAVGPVKVTVHVEEPLLPSNFAEKTFTFNVAQDVYYTSFETCPDGWTLTGDWQCGVPTNVGPAAAYAGTRCIATQIAGPHSNLQTWAGTTATSPDIDLTSSFNPNLSFRMWIDTEGATYDGANLKISNDGGATYTLVDTVMPGYPLTIAGEPAWGGHQAALGWQVVQANLSPYAGQTVRLRFSFRSDSSGTSPGVYIDDLLVQ